MATDSPESITRLLHDWSSGDQAALNKLMPLIYEELRKLAHGYMGHERPGHTLQTTALIHEAYLRLVDQRSAQWQNRVQFFAIAAQLMRRILVDYARRRKYQKRGGNAVKVPLEENTVLSTERSEEVVALDGALERLAVVDPRKARVVELRYFGGLEIPEIAEALGISPATVTRDWRMAKAWLRSELHHDA